MYVSKLELKNFRNYESAVIEFSPGINFITGENGSGKTNILEAVSVLSGIKSFRGTPDFNMVRWKNSGYYISAHVEENDSCKFEIGFSCGKEKSRKKVRIDDNEIKKVSDYYGKLLSVVISPGDINLINDGPEIRRNYFDSVISKLSIEYFNTLLSMRRIISSRNAVLRGLKERRITDTGELEPWDQLFCEKASVIINKRRDFITEYGKIFKKNYMSVSGKDDCPDLVYMNSSGVFDAGDLSKKLKDRRIRDIMSGSCSLGPQRDDFILTDGSVKFVNYGSQGQKRTAAVAMKLSESEIIRQFSGRKAVILVDDIFSELDSGRRERLISRISTGSQVIFTMVNIEASGSVFRSSRGYTIGEKGQISPYVFG